MVIKTVTKSLAVSISLLAFLATPTDALAVVQSLNSQTGQDQTFQNDSNVTITSSSNVHTLGWNGLLSIARGGTGAGSFTTGSIPFIGSGVFSQDNSNFFWDDTNNRLGIGTSSPTTTLDVSGNANVTSLTTTDDSTINSVTVGRGGGSLISNTVVGNDALDSNSNAGNNTALGYKALSRNTHSGESNTGVGTEALSDTTTGGFNSAFGHRALFQNTTGIQNVGIGANALQDTTSGSSNVATGFRALLLNTSGGGNVALGYHALISNLTGSNNIVLGWNAAAVQADGSTALTTPVESIYIGKSTRGFSNNDNNSIVIGTDAIGAGANKTVIGNSRMTDVYFGSSSANANIHAKRLFLGNSSVPGCIIIGDTAGGVGYITLVNGTLTVSSTPPSACQ